METGWTILQLDKAVGLGGQSEAWDKLNARDFNANPMVDSRFVTRLIQYFGNGSEHLCIFLNGGEIHSMCILHRQSMGVWASFLPSQSQIGPTLMRQGNHVEQLIAALPGHVVRIDFLCNELSDRIFQGATELPTSHSDHALTMSISLEGSFDLYWAARSRNLVKNISRYERRVADDAIEVEFRCVENHGSIESAVGRYAVLESKGWKGEQGTALGLNNVQGVFYKDLMLSFASVGHASVYELWFNDRLAASRLVISNSAMSIVLKTTYDESFEKYAPGRLLLRAVIEHMFAVRPNQTIEFYTNANADQLSWATHDRWIRHSSVFRGTNHKQAFDIFQVGHRVSLAGKESKYSLHSAVDIKIYKHPDEFPSEMETFFNLGDKQHFELGLSWYRNLINEVFKPEENVCFFVLRENSRLTAVLPLLVGDQNHAPRAESLSNYYTSIYAPILSRGAKPRDLAQLLIHANRSLGPQATFRFSPMDPGSRPYAVLNEALAIAGFIPFQFFCFGNWHLQADGDWASYLKSKSANLRSTIKRMTKKFESVGGTMEVVQELASLEEGMMAYEKVYNKSWKKAEPYPNFVTGLARVCAQQGALRLGLAWLNGVPVAAQLWIVSNGKANIYKVAYDEEFKEFSVGTLVTAMLMERVLDQDHVKEVDFLIGDDEYKKTWMSHRRERWGIIAYNPRTLRGLIGLIREILGRVFKEVRANFEQKK